MNNYLDLNLENSRDIFNKYPGGINNEYEGECPQTYRKINGECVKVCMACDTSKKSRNSSVWIDPCFPSGIFGGLYLGGNVCSNSS